MLQKNLVFYDGIEAYLDKCGKTAEAVEEIILFGSAKCAEKVRDFLIRRGQWGKVRYVADNDKLKQGTDFYDKRILPPEAILGKESEDAVIVLASGAAHIIRKQLKGMGISEERITEFAFTNLELDPTPAAYIQEHLTGYEKTYDLLKDEKSCRVYENLLNYKMSRNPAYLEQITDDEADQYFDPELVDFSGNTGIAEFIVDCGAYTGDTFFEVYKRTGGRIGRYVCFEADGAVFRVLEENIRNAGINPEGVTLLNLGCWSEKGTVGFESKGAGSSSISLDPSAGERIEVDAADHVLEGCDVTFVKMDIEGAEENALMGMRELISRSRPVLAISIYHSLQDFYRIPQVIREIRKDYDFYIRHYRSLSDSETVCYAIPQP